ncbi:hypothetical protein SMU80_09778, partial [Streptococcus mutans SF1]
MAITDEEIQKLQGKVQDFASAKKGTSINTGTRDNPVEYKIVNSINGTTQAIAVAPV